MIQQGFATNEVYTYTNVLEEWKRPVDFFLIHWMGYENYPAMMTIRTDRLNAQRACLDLLVPTLQRAWVEFLNEPTEVADTLVAINETFDTFFSITPDLNKQAIAMFSEFELATNGSDQVYGNFDPERVNRLFDIVEGIYAGRDKPLPATLVAADVYTNAFIDDEVGLAPQPAGESSGS